MSSDWQSSDASMQEREHPDWDSSYEDQEQDTQYHAAKPVVITNPENHDAEDFYEEDDLIDPMNEPEGRWEGIARQISPIVVPLVIGSLIFLLTFLLALKDFSFIGTAGLLPFGLTLLAVAIIQGTVLYYAGANDLFWLIGFTSGFALFLILGCFAIFGPIVSLTLLGILILLSIVIVRLTFHPVPEGRVDIVHAFGKYRRTLYPGLNYILPWEHIEYKLNTRETHWTCPTQKVQISRDEDIHLAATISYQLMPEDAHLSVLYVNNWEENLHELFRTTLQSVVNELTPEDFIAWPHGFASRQLSSLSLDSGDLNQQEDYLTRWDRINTHMAQRMQDQVATWGVQINGVQIQDITLIPRLAKQAETGSTNSLAARKQSGPIKKDQPSTTRIVKEFSSAARIPQEQKSTNKVLTSATESAAASADYTTVSMPPPQPKAQAQAAPSTRPARTSGNAKGIKEEALGEAYAAVRNGRITDPTTIRNIALRFEAIANDPEANKNVSFDAARGAQALFQRADVLEAHLAAIARKNQESQSAQIQWSDKHS